MKTKYTQLKKQWGGYSAFDKWMNQEFNNSHLLLIATYHDLVPMFKTILKKENYDLKKFYVAVEKLGRKSKEDRRNKLKQIAKLKM